MGAGQFIDEMMRALGGRETLEALRSLSVTADCTGPEGPFETRVSSFRPGAAYFHQRAGERATEIWSTPGKTWTTGEDGGSRELPTAVRDFVRAHEFHLLLLEIESRFSAHRLGATDSAGTCQRVEMLDEAGLPAAICLERSSGLPSLLELNPSEAQGPIRVRFSDWKAIEGIRYFHSFVLTEGSERTFTYDYKALEPNSVTALRFVEPPQAHREDHAALVEILHDDRRAHLAGDAALLGSHLDDSVVEVHGGDFGVRDRDQIEASFEEYFAGGGYEVWEDASPPVIRVSESGRMAFVVRRVQASRRDISAEGQVRAVRFTSAYTATYEKRDGGWRMTSVTSTFLPS